MPWSRAAYAAPDAAAAHFPMPRGTLFPSPARVRGRRAPDGPGLQARLGPTRLRPGRLEAGGPVRVTTRGSPGLAGGRPGPGSGPQAGRAFWPAWLARRPPLAHPLFDFPAPRPSPTVRRPRPPARRLPAIRRAGPRTWSPRWRSAVSRRVPWGTCSTCWPAPWPRRRRAPPRSTPSSAPSTTSPPAQPPARPPSFDPVVRHGAAPPGPRPGGMVRPRAVGRLKWRPRTQ